MKHFYYFLLFIIFATPLFSEPASNISISGNKIYSSEVLIDRLKLVKANNSNNNFHSIADKIQSFYKSKGYSLVRVYLIEETKSTLSIFIDEGRIDQIRIKGFNNIETAEIKLYFRLPHDIYNKNIVKKQIKEIKTELEIDISIILIETENYDDAFFQLDNSFRIPFIGESQLPFFDKYGYRYSIIVSKSKKNSSNKSASSKKKMKFDYGLKINVFSYLQPWISGIFPSIFLEDDITKSKIKTKFLYSPKTYKTPPQWSNNELNTEYYPNQKMISKDLNPRLVFNIDHSESARPELGLLEYDYIFFRGLIEPGLNIFNDLYLYLGFGGEKYYLYNYTEDPEIENPVVISKETEYWNILRVTSQLGKIFSFIDENQLYIQTGISYYFNNGDNFKEYNIVITKYHDFGNFINYTSSLDFEIVTGDVPFYHDPTVAGSNFRASFGYKSHKIFRFSNSIEMSVYKNYLYLGWFADSAVFKGYGITLDGWQFGAVTGPSTRILILDQLQFSFSCGYDYLVSTKQKNFLMNFSLKNRW